ncbi:hypothetical protein BAZOLSSOX_328 [uncultured Gammaproteobacteria bacterium]|nr:hypothetical protein BAZOLSSOX_328 [uncultured Gammaproteobacteria bacterium]
MIVHIHHHTGGLEIKGGVLLNTMKIHHHTGGLEKYQVYKAQL